MYDAALSAGGTPQPLRSHLSASDALAVHHSRSVAGCRAAIGRPPPASVGAGGSVPSESGCRAAPIPLAQGRGAQGEGAAAAPTAEAHRMTQTPSLQPARMLPRL